MEARGGGLRSLELVDCSHIEPDYYQLKATFETADAMGANFINSILEQFAQCLTEEIAVYKYFTGAEKGGDSNEHSEQLHSGLSCKSLGRM